MNSGGGRGHFVASQNTPNNFSSGYVFLSPKTLGFSQVSLLSWGPSFLPGLSLPLPKISALLVFTSVSSSQVCENKQKLKHKLGTEGKDSTARPAFLFNTSLLATPIRSAVAPLFVPGVAEGLFPSWKSQSFLARSSFSMQGFSFPQQSSPSATPPAFRGGQLPGEAHKTPRLPEVILAHRREPPFVRPHSRVS